MNQEYNNKTYYKLKWINTYAKNVRKNINKNIIIQDI
jgi:hypothetical protein